MLENRSVSIGRDAQGNVIVTGDDNRVYVFPGVSEFSEDMLKRFERGALKPHDAPGAIPLPALTLRIEYADGKRVAWVVRSVYPSSEDTKCPPRTVPLPWHENPGFARALDGFWELSRRAIEDDEEYRSIYTHARILGDALTALLTPEDVQTLINVGRHGGPPPLIIIESSDDLILALPWELLRIEDRYAVNEGRLDVARCVPTDGLPHLKSPKKPVSLLINVSAPEGSGLNYEQESYYVTRALHDHVGIVVNEMGELRDLVEGVCSEPYPVGVHFSGHGGPGELVFEDELGDAHNVRVDELITQIHRAATERFPQFFYLASCHGGTPPSADASSGGNGTQGGIASTAAELHREGVTQVVTYFGPVYDSQSTWAEAAFYSELARGRRTRDAVRAARQAMARPLTAAEKEITRDVTLSRDQGSTPFAWAQLVFYHRGTDYPLGTRIDPKYVEAMDAPPAREEETLLGFEQVRILRRGFIGRRKELHALRRDLRAGKYLHVVQGLGGLGKSAFCIEALKVYRRRGREIFILWCAEVQKDADPASALLRQFSTLAEQHLGEDWASIVASVDNATIVQPTLQYPAARLVALLYTMLQYEGQKPLVLYLDNLESLLIGPDNEDPRALGEWRDDNVAAMWGELTHFAKTSGGRLALLASCRYRHQDFREWLFPFARLPNDAIWRMIGWFGGIRKLSIYSRDRLVEHLAGHPRSVEFLDALISDQITKWEETHGALAKVSTRTEAEDEWSKIVDPAIPFLERRLSEDLLFDALWNRVLDETARRLLMRATVLRRPAEWGLLRVLFDEGTGDNNPADAAIRRLRDASLLTELEERGAEGRIKRVFEVHPSVARLAEEHTPDAAEMHNEGHRRAGDFLERRAQTSASWDDVVEAAYHLGEIGDTDRAFELLFVLTQWLYERGRFMDGMIWLGTLKEPKNLTSRNLGAFSELQGEAFVGLGDLKRALSAFAEATKVFEALIEKDPTNAGWQRDLSVSYEKLGDVAVAAGRLDDARTAYEDSLKIRKILAEADPTNAGWQRDLSVSYNKLGDVAVAAGRLDDARTAYEDSLKIRKILADADPTNAGWQRDLSVSYEKLGDVAVAAGRLDDARTAYEDSLKIAKQLAEADPTNAGWQRDLSVSYNKLGDVAVAAGRLDDARTAYEDSLKIAKQLAEADPTNAGWQRDLSVSYEKLGDVAVAAGRLDDARTAYEDSLKIRKILAEADPTDIGAQTDLAAAYWRVAKKYAEVDGLDAKAEESLKQGLEILYRLRGESSLAPEQEPWIEAFETALQETTEKSLQDPGEPTEKVYRETKVPSIWERTTKVIRSNFLKLFNRLH